MKKGSVTPDKKNLQIEGLRAICLLTVMLHHYSSGRGGENVGLHSIMREFYHGGVIAVGIFFMISGYFVFPPKHQDFLAGSLSNTGKYFLHKIRRLYIPLAIAVTIIWLAFRFGGIPGKNISFNDYLYNLFRINRFYYIKYIDGAHWYLTQLFLFIGISLILRSLRWNNLFYIIPAWFICSLIIPMYITHDNILTRITECCCGNVYNLHKLSYISFLLGVSLRLFTSHDNTSKWIASLYIISLSLSLFLIPSRYKLVDSVGLICGFAIFALCVHYKCCLFAIKPLISIGQISYHTYLLHMMIGLMILLRIQPHIGDFMGIFCTIICMLVLGYIFYRIDTCLHLQNRSYGCKHNPHLKEK